MQERTGKQNAQWLHVDIDESSMTTESEIPTENLEFQQLADMSLSFKEQTNKHFEGISTNMSEMQFQMQEQMKTISKRCNRNEDVTQRSMGGD